MGNQKNPGENSNVEHSEATVEDLEGRKTQDSRVGIRNFQQNNFLFSRVRASFRRNRSVELGFRQHGKQR